MFPFNMFTIIVKIFGEISSNKNTDIVTTFFSPSEGIEIAFDFKIA